MPTKRSRVTRNISARVTAAALEAYRNRDFLALHAALRLPPWSRSPLPISDCALGVDQGPPPEDDRPGPWRDGWHAARELQRELAAASGELPRPVRQMEDAGHGTEPSR